MKDFPPEAMAELRLRAKRQLRKRMRALRTALPPRAAQARSGRIVERLLALSTYHDARSVALFWPMEQRREVDLRPLDEAARAAGKLVYYPYMQPQGDVIKTGFRRVADVAQLADCGRRFFEPPESAPAASPSELDFVVVPALAADAAGHRIGYGAGFYDATLPEFCPPATAVVVVFEFQLIAEVPSWDEDIPCNLVVTEGRCMPVG